jgi:type II secretory pathway component PulF
MNFDFDILSRLAMTLVLYGVGIALASGVLYVAHFLLTLPMRRAERARLFLDLVETALKNGQPLEETLISVAQSRDLSLGVRFHLVAAWLEQNLRLEEALEKVPGFLPPQITAMLRAGQKIGDIGKVIPACRQLLKDAVSQTRSAMSYLVILTLVLTPVGIWVLGVLEVLVFPKFMDISEGLGVGNNIHVSYLYQHRLAIIYLQCFVLGFLWVAAFVYIGGPRAAAWFQGLYYRLPWRRKRMQRDFSTLLAILLDSGVSEPDALTLAAECTANRLFRRRAARAVQALQQGETLTAAVQRMDDSGEFRWRLTNAIHGRGGFLRALAGWHEWLDAKAFQEEQGVAHGITTALVLWSGLFVGVVVVSVFMFLVSVIDAGVLW